MIEVDNNVLGVDVSKWQEMRKEIDFAAVAKAGIRFVIMRASAGTRIDPKFRDNWREVVTEGLIPQAYHYLECPGADAVDQALVFLSQLDAVDALPLWIGANVEPSPFLIPIHGRRILAPALPPLCDAEEGPLKPKDLLRWLDAVEGRVGRVPWIYTMIGWWGTAIGNDKRFSRYPLHAADWTPPLNLPLPWTDCIVHQYTNKGEVPGIPTKVDMNKFNGTLEDLLWMAGSCKKESK